MKFFIKIIISNAKGESTYCCNFASEKSDEYTFSTFINEIKKIITHKKAIEFFISNETCLRAREYIEDAISNKEYKTIVKTLPFIIKLNSFLTSLKKLAII